jgi:hypothetical protein
MARQPDLPPEVARAFIQNMKAYFAESDLIKQDAIAVLQLRLLQDHWNGKLRLDDVRKMFMEMREHLESS